MFADPNRMLMMRYYLASLKQVGVFISTKMLGLSEGDVRGFVTVTATEST
jgi:hypothetical protein